MSDIIIDLGEDGIILIEPTEVDNTPLDNDDPIIQTSVVDTAKQIGTKIKVGAETVLNLPLTGLAKAFLAALPYASSDDSYQLDEFTVEFNLGLKTENGVDNPIVVSKIMPEGAFKCTFKWKQKDTPPPTTPSTT